MNNIQKNNKIKTRTVLVNKHKTSVSLEDEFWVELKKLSKNKKSSLNKLISKIDISRKTALSSAVRLYVLDQLIRAKRKSN